MSFKCQFLRSWLVWGGTNVHSGRMVKLVGHIPSYANDLLSGPKTLDIVSNICSIYDHNKGTSKAQDHAYRLFLYRCLRLFDFGIHFVAFFR